MNKILTGTFTGRLIDLEKFSKEDIDLRDVSVSLARQNRYCGHTAIAWPVGKHLILCGMMYNHLYNDIDRGHHALFIHDVSETWIQDIANPIKHNLMLSKFDEIETHIDDVVYDFFGLNDLRHAKHIKQFDKIALLVEHNLIAPNMSIDGVKFTDEEKEIIEALKQTNFSITRQLIELTEAELIEILFDELNVIYTEGQMGEIAVK